MPELHVIETRLSKLSPPVSMGGIVRLLRLVWSVGPVVVCGWLLMIPLQAAVPAALAWVAKCLLEALMAPPHGATWPSMAILLVALLLLEQLLSAASAWMRAVLSDRMQDRIQEEIQAQVERLDLAYLETPQYYDLLFQARVDARSRPLSLMESGGAILQHTLTLGAMAVLLGRYSPWVALLLPISMLPAFWGMYQSTIRHYLWRKSRVPEERKSQYLDWLLTEREPALELRLFRMGPTYREAFKSLRAQLRLEQQTLLTKDLFRQVLSGVAATAGMLAGLLWMVRRLGGGHSLGDLLLFTQVFLQGQRLIQALVSQAGEAYRSALFIDHLFHFLDLKPHSKPPVDLKPNPLESESEGPPPAIRFSGVRFRYPHQEGWALDGLDIAVKEGETLAIVGDNGAGKSTLIKLMAGFYDAIEGRVEVFGRDVRAWPQEALRSQFTALFQSPVHYHASVYENLAQADQTSLYDRNRLEEAARQAGADDFIRHLPGGYETLLGHWFGGLELSGGEWQRLALGRAFLSSAPILLLDEPTSAMDSWAEGDWLERFDQFARNRTVLLITHRFTTAMRADRILVMEHGRVVEAGTHAALLSRGGKYATSWKRQMNQNTAIAAGR